jgi:di/tricarboxylate transporter
MKTLLRHIVATTCGIVGIFGMPLLFILTFWNNRMFKQLRWSLLILIIAGIPLILFLLLAHLAKG